MAHIRPATNVAAEAIKRLVRDVDTLRKLTESTMSRSMEALRDFQAIAAGAGLRASSRSRR
jgi:hypothetical protein